MASLSTTAPSERNSAQTSSQKQACPVPSPAPRQHQHGVLLHQAAAHRAVEVSAADQAPQGVAQARVLARVAAAGALGQPVAAWRRLQAVVHSCGPILGPVCRSACWTRIRLRPRLRRCGRC